MTARSTRDGRRQSRLIRGNKDGFEICTVNHAKGGEVRVDATVTYCPDGGVSAVQAHEYEELSGDGWFRSYTPQEEDGCYIVNEGGGNILNEDTTWDEKTNDVTVVQPNEDGSYWRKIVRNKMVRMKESRRVKAAKKWMAEMVGEDNAGQVLSSWGPYTSTIGQVYKKNDLSLPAVTTRALDSTKMPA